MRHAMFLIQFHRFMWKEYRANRAFWLSCAGMGLAIQLLTWWISIDLEARAQGLRATPILFGALFAAGCGAMLFAGEREERTNDWLLALSARTDSVLIAKFVFAIASTLI